MYCVIVDLDGTLSSCGWRRPFVMCEKPDWKSFFESLNADAPVQEVVDLLHSQPQGIARLLVTARPEQYRYMTSWWLMEHGIVYDRLLMRRSGDWRPDPVVKQEILQRIRDAGFEVIFVVDDRLEVIDMWRAEGLEVVAVTDPCLPPIIPIMLETM